MGLADSSNMASGPSVDTSSLVSFLSNQATTISLAFVFEYSFKPTHDLPDASRVLIVPSVPLIGQDPELDNSACDLGRLGRKACRGAHRSPAGLAKLPEEMLQKELVLGLELRVLIELPSGRLVKLDAVALETVWKTAVSQLLRCLNA